MKRRIIVAFLLAILVVICSCGDEKWKDYRSGNNSNNGTNNNNGTVSSSSVSSIHGHITTEPVLAYTGSTNSPLVKVSSSLNSFLDNATLVEVTSYDDNSNIIDKKVVKPRNAYFNTTVKTSNSGGKIRIDVTADGFVPFTKVIGYASSANINIPVILSVSKKRVFHMDSSSTVQTPDGRSVLAMYAYKNKSGQLELVSAYETASRTKNGEKPVYVVELKREDLFVDVAFIKMDVSVYDNLSDGMGIMQIPTSTSEDEEIIIAGFDHLTLTDADTGDKVFNNAALSRLNNQSSEPIAWVTRQVDCKNLFGDGDTSTPDKYDVNVYVLDNDSWKSMKKGYVVVSYDSTVVKNASDVCKRSSSEYVRMGIYKSDFTWMSLGYPKSWLDSKGKKTYCADLEFKDENGNFINSFIAYSYPKGNGYASFGVGNIKLVEDSSDSSKTTSIIYYNPFTYEPARYVITLNDSQNGCSQVIITIPDNRSCSVKGKVMDGSGNALKNEYVYAYDNEKDTFYGAGVSGDNGEYTIKVSCNRQVRLDFYDNPSKSAAVNGNVANDESSDGGTVAYINNFVKRNAPSYGNGYISIPVQKVGYAHTVYFYGYDRDGNYPVSYQLMRNNIQVISGSFNSGSFNYQTYIAPPRLQVGKYTYVLNLTDSKGNKSSYTLGTVEMLSTGNRNPVIAYAYALPDNVTKGGEVKLYGHAYDLDGDNVTYRWSADSGVCRISDGTSEAASVTRDTAGKCYITLEATDARGMVSTKSFYVDFLENNGSTPSEGGSGSFLFFLTFNLGNIDNTTNNGLEINLNIGSAAQKF